MTNRAAYAGEQFESWIVTMKMSSHFDTVALRHSVIAALVLVGMLVATLLIIDTSRAHLQPRIGVTEAAFDALRLRASAGEWDANRSLTLALLDRFEVSHDSEDLFEAMVWLDMDWDAPTPEHINLQFRIYKRYCNHRVLRWHWLCNSGE